MQINSELQKVLWNAINPQGYKADCSAGGGHFTCMSDKETTLQTLKMNMIIRVVPIIDAVMFAQEEGAKEPSTCLQVYFLDEFNILSSMLVRTPQSMESLMAVEQKTFKLRKNLMQVSIVCKMIKTENAKKQKYYYTDFEPVTVENDNAELIAELCRKDDNGKDIYDEKEICDMRILRELKASNSPEVLAKNVHFLPLSEQKQLAE